MAAYQLYDTGLTVTKEDELLSLSICKYSSKKIYLDKDNLIDDKVVIDGVTVREPKRDRLIQHLFKIQELISLFDNKEYNELIRRTSFSVQSIADKSNLTYCATSSKLCENL